MAHKHTLASFGDLRAEMIYDSENASLGRINVYGVGDNMCQACYLFSNPTERDEAIATAFKRLGDLADVIAADQKAFAIKNGFPH